MKIEDIIYETTREVRSVEDKLRIGTVFLFCQQLGNVKLSELLYADNHAKFIDDLNNEYKEFSFDLSINFDDVNIKNAFYNTLEKVKKDWDSDGFLKAIHEKDEFAIAICDIVKKTKI